jgi:hypothetical protein
MRFNQLDFPLFLLLLCSILISCTSSAFVRQQTPVIHGEIYVAGEPAIGVRVYLSRDGSDSLCLKHSQSTHTGPQGEFSLPAIKNHMSYTPLMTHYLDEWVVCAEFDGQRIMLYSDNRYGMGSVTDSVQLRCRFDNGQYAAEYCNRVR